MKWLTSAGGGLVSLLLFSACGSNADHFVPTAPTVIVGPPSTAAGSIRVSALTHPSGATLHVQECGPSFTGIPGTHLCNDEWKAAFDVTSAVDLTEGYVTVTFEAGGERCGTVGVDSQNFAAGRERLVGTSEPVYVTHEREGYDNLAVEQRCELPATTTRLVVQLWDPRRPATPLLRREFDYVFTFASPRP